MKTTSTSLLTITDVKNINSDQYMTDVQQNWRNLKCVSEDVKMANPDICRAAIAQNRFALQLVRENVQLAHPSIPLAAVQQNGRALLYVPESLKTNVEALAKLYTTSEEQLRSDLTLLQINDDVIEEVICYLKAPIATSSSMIVDLLGTGNDSKQPTENAGTDTIIADLLPTIKGYLLSTQLNSENDERESKSFSY